MSAAGLDRTVFRISGVGAREWLLSLITNSITGPDMTFAALLTPQGKIIADFFIRTDSYHYPKDTEDGVDSILLETASKFAPALEKRLKMYRLRKPIKIERVLLYVLAVWEGRIDSPHQEDPRHPSLGSRLIRREPANFKTMVGDYDAHRLSLGVPDSQWDFDTQQVFPADANMDLLNGVNFSKGCFVGQEVVSRMKRMTTVKKRMRGILFEGDAKAGDRILSGERVIGDVLHTKGKAGMAMIRLDRLRAAEYELTLNGAPVAVMRSVTGEDV